MIPDDVVEEVRARADIVDIIGEFVHLKKAGKDYKDIQENLRRIDRHINWYRANLPSPDAIAETDYWPSREARLEVPTLLIWGNDDTIFDPAFIALMEASATNLTVLRLDGVGHAPQFEATSTVNEALVQHVGESQPDTGE